MKKGVFVLVSLGAAWGAVGGCYNPELAPAPFLCGKGGACPDGYQCYGGICMDHTPECMQPGYVFDGTMDRDYEPNNVRDLAVDDLVCSQQPGTEEYECRCPPVPTQAGYRRAPMMNGVQNMVICPEGDEDNFKFYLLQNEVLKVELVYQYGPGRDLDLEVRREDGTVVASSTSTNDDEEVEFQAQVEGWYYIRVIPKYAVAQYDQNGNVVRPADMNTYSLSYTLNPYGCNNNGSCDAYETHESCPSDCQDPAYCGNKVCDAGESPTDCPEDCFCGNGICEPTENSTTCPQDCSGC